jgi:hypothetical protein
VVIAKGRVGEEDEAEVVAGADALQAGLGRGVGLVDGVRAEVGEFDLLDVALDHLDGVEVVGVAGQPLDAQPVGLGGDPGGHSAWTCARAGCPRSA